MFKRTSLRKLSAKFLLVLSGLVIGLMLAEGVGHILGPPYEQGDLLNRNHQCDRSVGWRGIPHASVELSYGYDHQVTWNAEGMHDGEHTRQKPADVFRILMLGDSMIEAVAVEEKLTSQQILEDTLNANAPPNLKFEVLSAGMMAWGPGQELTYFRSAGQFYQPDLVLAVWFPANDLSDIVPDHIATVGPEGGIHCYAPYFAICDGVFDPNPWYSAPGISKTWETCSAGKKIVANALNFAYYYSRLYQRLAPAMTTIFNKVEFAHPYAPWLDSGENDRGLGYAYQLTTDVYTQLAREADQQGAATAFVIAPVSQAVDFEAYPEVRARVVAETPVLGQADPTLPNKTFIRLMADKGFPVLDMHHQFVAHLQAGGPILNWPNDNHWNVLGNQMAGETIAHWLIEQGLVPNNTNGD
jgi:hypothetical protein